MKKLPNYLAKCMLYLIINYNKKNINNEIADICETGAYESGSIIDIDHCQKCAETCRRCAEECRNMS